MSQTQLDYLEEGFDPVEFAGRFTPWQEVIHGRSRLFRSRVAADLMSRGQREKAVQYALCGTNDQVVDDGDVYKVRPRRCGNPCCPRCSRYRGLKFVRRVQDHLRAHPHGEMFHVILTQQVNEDEPLSETRARFEGAFERWWSVWRKRLEVFGGLRTTHITWSDSGGWHYHAHLVVDCREEAGLVARRVEAALAAWREVKLLEGDTRSHLDVARHVAGAGDPVEDLDEGSGDLWSEASDPIAKCIQYVCRDVCQGVDSWNLEDAGDHTVELLDELRGAKTRRLYGAWRKPVPADAVVPVVAESAKNADGPESFDRSVVAVGRVDELLFRAGGGDSQAIDVCLWLLRNCNNSAGVGRRLVMVVGRFVHVERSAVLVA